VLDRLTGSHVDGVELAAGLVPTQCRGALLPHVDLVRLLRTPRRIEGEVQGPGRLVEAPVETVLVARDPDTAVIQVDVTGRIAIRGEGESGDRRRDRGDDKGGGQRDAIPAQRPHPLSAPRDLPPDDRSGSAAHRWGALPVDIDGWLPNKSIHSAPLTQSGP